MFDSLKKKLSSWLKGQDEKPKSKAKKSKTKTKNAKSKSKALKKENLPSDKQLKKIAEKAVELPVKFDTAELKYEPDLEKIKYLEQEDKEQEKPKKQGFFAKLAAKITGSKISNEDVEPILMELEIILLEHNVAIEIIDKIKAKISTELIDQAFQKKNIEKIVIAALKQAISDSLIEPPNLIEQIKQKSGVYKIIFFGINGTGKTTSLAKIAHYLKKNNIKTVIAAADTFRAASIEQLEIHGQRLGIPVIKHDYGSDPAAVAFDAIKYAEKNHFKCILIDTAGRMYTKDNLLKEMEKIIRVTQPDLKLFVGEATTGNDSVEQAKTFNDTIGIDGIILTKADVDDKGGAALSVSSVTNKPIYFLGTGQGMEDLKPFKKSLILDSLNLD